MSLLFAVALRFEEFDEVEPNLLLLPTTVNAVDAVDSRHVHVLIGIRCIYSRSNLSAIVNRVESDRVEVLRTNEIVLTSYHTLASRSRRHSAHKSFGIYRTIHGVQITFTLRLFFTS